MDRGIEGGAIPEARIDIEVLNHKKENFLPEPLFKNEKNGEKKGDLRQEQTISILDNNANFQSVASLKEVSDDKLQIEAPPAKFFSLRKYLKNVCESVSNNHPQLQEDISLDETEPDPPLKDTPNCPCCKTWKSFSMTLIIMGMVITALGFIVPFYCIISRDELEDTDKVSESEMKIQEKTILCRLIGILIFSTGTVIYMVKKDTDEIEQTDATNFYPYVETDDVFNEKCAEALEMAVVQSKKESVLMDTNEEVAPQQQAILQIKGDITL